MNNLLDYLLESGTCLLVFFLLYRAFLKNETYYNLNRGYLLITMLFSLLVPLADISLPVDSSSQLKGFRLEPLVIYAPGGAGDPGNSRTLEEIAGIFYLSILPLLSLRFLLILARLRKLRKKGRILEDNDHRLILHPKAYPPFSFLRCIYISQNHYATNRIDDIIEHEKAHVRQFHTLDIILAELLIILQWFNPVAWLYKRLVSENHEFLADEAVINRGFSPEEYQLRILAQLFGIRSMPAVHNFNQSITKKRLKMMEKSKSTPAASFKMLPAIPAALLLFYLFACSGGPAETPAGDDPAAAENPTVYYKVDQAAMPEAGIKALREYIARNIRYPEQAQKKGIEGRVYIRFIIDEHGKIVSTVESREIPPPPDQGTGLDDPPPETADISGVVVVSYRPPEGLDRDPPAEDVQLLVDEAIRVISECDINFKPALIDGIPVKSAWTIPVTFALQ